jgi:hypothetical protein
MEIKNIKHQYIWKGSKKMARKGKPRIKKGVIVAGLTSDNRVVIGFTLCHKNDKYDYVDGKREPGFGIKTALERAIKWKDTKKSIKDSRFRKTFPSKIQEIRNHNHKNLVIVPQSVHNNLIPFIERCRRYYKNAVGLPMWTLDVK